MSCHLLKGTVFGAKILGQGHTLLKVIRVFGTASLFSVVVVGTVANVFQHL